MKKSWVWVLGLTAAAAIPCHLAARASEAAAAAPSAGDVALDPADVPPPIRRREPTTVHVELEAREVVADLGPGKPYFFWTFNGTVPGPMIRAMEGDHVEVRLCNRLGNVEPHNLDLHAVVGPGGGAGVTNVEPGECRTLRFLATRPGAYIYHCAGEGMAWEHIAHGMYGLVMIEPVGGLPPADAEFIVGQSEWYLTDAKRTDAAISSVPFYDLDEEKAAREQPDLYTFNGHTQALTHIWQDMTAQQGDRVRIFFVNSGPNRGANAHVVGQIFDQVYTGSPETPTRNEETVHVPPGSAAVFEMTADVPGEYMLVDHAIYRVPKGALGTLHVQPVGPWPLDRYAPQATSAGH